MMQLLIFSIEYFITGAPVLLWVFVVSRIVNFTMDTGTSSYLIVALIPLVYLWGMMADFIMSKRLKSRKSSLKAAAYDKLKKDGVKVTPDDIDRLEAKLWIHAVELAKASQWRSVRDRIARGFVLNIEVTVLLTAVWVFLKGATNQQPIGLLLGVVLALVLVGAGVSAITYSMWQRFQEHSIKFDVEAWIALNEMQQAAKVPPSETN
jgi:hypothetical protein